MRGELAEVVQKLEQRGHPDPAAAVEGIRALGVHVLPFTPAEAVTAGPLPLCGDWINTPVLTPLTLPPVMEADALASPNPISSVVISTPVLLELTVFPLNWTVPPPPP